MADSGSRDEINLSESEDGRTFLNKGDYALVITSDNKIELVIPTPDDSNEDEPAPDRALMLIAIAEKLHDQEWVDRLMSEYWAELEAKNPR